LRRTARSPIALRRQHFADRRLPGTAPCRLTSTRPFALALAAGAQALRHPEQTDYGGYRGYVADPDGHVWEIVHAPGFGLSEVGRLMLPD
jgi:hypothetical protein